MKVKLTNIYCGSSGRHDPGAVITVPDAEGMQLVAGGYAIQILDAQEIETTSMGPAQTAVSPAQDKRPRARGRQ